jgi:hypothetical protein
MNGAADSPQIAAKKAGVGGSTPSLTPHFKAVSGIACCPLSPLSVRYFFDEIRFGLYCNLKACQSIRSFHRAITIPD